MAARFGEMIIAHVTFSIVLVITLLGHALLQLRKIEHFSQQRNLSGEKDKPISQRSLELKSLRDDFRLFQPLALKKG